MDANVRVTLARRPTGWVSEDDFRIEEGPPPVPAEGEVLVRGHFLSLDPYQRMRMSDAPSYAPCVALGEVMVGEVVGEVVASRSPLFAPGDWVVGPLGWQSWGCIAAKRVRRIEDSSVPRSAYLGVLGMPGITAWVGMTEIAPPSSGQTVVVSAASGAVGGVAGQIARFRGARVVGIAGGAAKCEYVVRDLGFDACIDYRTPDFAERLAASVPDGVDVYFDNVGGAVLDAVLPVLRPHGRIALCGQVSQYNETLPWRYANLRSLLTRRLTLRGFIVTDHRLQWPQALAELAAWVAAGRLAWRENVVAGIRNAPRAFLGLLRGEKIGKQLVRLDIGA